MRYRMGAAYYRFHGDGFICYDFLGFDNPFGKPIKFLERGVAFIDVLQANNTDILYTWPDRVI